MRKISSALRGNDDAFASDSGCGMTIREYFAAAAMRGLLAADIDWQRSTNDIAELATELADTLIARLSKRAP